MKKISLIFLSLVLVFMTACSADDPAKNEEAFLERVKGKTTSGGMAFGVDGKTFTLLGDGFPGTFKFIETRSSISALYSVPNEPTVRALVTLGEEEDSVTISMVSDDISAGDLRQAAREDINAGFLLK